MTYELLFAGFGGQGVLSLGMTVAYGAMLEGKEVSWMPSYGPEMRGGTANCIVIVSDRRISSPIVTTFDVVVALNQPSVVRFEAFVKPGGMLFYDSGSIIIPPTRSDIDIVPVPATQTAGELKNPKVGSIVLLGAIMSRTRMMESNGIMKALKLVLPERHHHLLPLNEQALRHGMAFMEHLVADENPH